MKYRFIFYGLIGLGMEIFWTGAASALSGNVRLSASTYLWMFPIYGLAVFMEPVHDRIRALPWLLRGLIWVSAIWFIEYATGGLIRLITGSSPWDYTGVSRWAIDGLIRLDMAPLWFAVGLGFERVHDFLVRHLKVD